MEVVTVVFMALRDDMMTQLRKVGIDNMIYEPRMETVNTVVFVTPEPAKEYDHFFDNYIPRPDPRKQTGTRGS